MLLLTAAMLLSVADCCYAGLVVTTDGRVTDCWFGLVRCHPATNRLLTFDGGALHGVVPVIPDQQQQVTCTGSRQTTFNLILLYEIVCCCKAEFSRHNTLLLLSYELLTYNHSSKLLGSLQLCNCTFRSDRFEKRITIFSISALFSVASNLLIGISC